jgi:hypothetical protein
MNEITRVALFALVYREAHKTRAQSSENLLEDVDVCSGEVSLATLLGSCYLTEEDWVLLNQLQGPDDFLPLARRIVHEDPFRAEVLLHACPPHGRRSNSGWAASLVARWDAVAAARVALRDEGLTATRDDLDELAVGAYKTVTGKTHADYLDEYEDILFPEYA